MGKAIMLKSSNDVDYVDLTVSVRLTYSSNIRDFLRDNAPAGASYAVVINQNFEEAENVLLGGIFMLNFSIGGFVRYKGGTYNAASTIGEYSARVNAGSILRVTYR